MQRRISQGHGGMILYNFPSVVSAIIAILVIGLGFGWGTLLKLPFNFLIVWLIFAAGLVFVVRWHEISKEEHDYKIGLESFKQEIVEAVREGMKQAIMEAIEESKKWNKGAGNGM